MTVARREVSHILSSCLQDDAQNELVREWSEQPDAPGLDNATAALLFAAALGDTTSWQALVARHPRLADLDVGNMPAVLDRLST